MMFKKVKVEGKARCGTLKMSASKQVRLIHTLYTGLYHL